MTLSCPSRSCPMCIGTQCNACRREPRTPGFRCTHDHVERHSAMPALEANLESERPTLEIDKVLAGRIEIDLEDAAAAADFLELVARVLRTKKRIVMVVE